MKRYPIRPDSIDPPDNDTNIDNGNEHIKLSNKTTIDISEIITEDISVQPTKSINLNGKNPSYINKANQVNHNVTNNLFVFNKDDSKPGDTPQSTNNRNASPRKKKFLQAISLILCLLMIAGIITIVLASKISQKNTINEFNELAEKANEAFFTEDYVSSAKLYRKMSKLAFDDETYVGSLCYEALSRYYLALNSSEEKAKQRQLRICSRLLAPVADPQEYDTMYVYFALATISNVYYELGTSTKDNNWKKIIEMLDKEASNVNSKGFHEIKNNVEADTMQHVYEALVLYYSSAYINGVYALLDPETNEKVHLYFFNLIPLDSANDYYTGSADYQHHAHIVARAADAMVGSCIMAKDNDLRIETIESARQLCMDVLDTIPFDKNYLYSQATLRRVIGKCYWYQAAFSENIEDRATNLCLVYYELQPLIHMESSDDDSLKEIALSGTYVPLTYMSSTEDLEAIVKNYKTYIATDTFQKDDLVNQLTFYISVCETCSFSLKYYGYNKDVYEYGLQLSETLYKNISFLDPIFQKSVEKLNEFFKDYDSR